MPISAKIREQLLNSFRAELAEHVQLLTNGLLTIEQQNITGEAREALLGDIFRAAHSLKGAARAMGVTMIEQLAHALEDVLAALQRNLITVQPQLFTACYGALDAIQLVQAAYESGETTPPATALVALSNLDLFRPAHAKAAPVETNSSSTTDPSGATKPIELPKPIEPTELAPGGIPHNAPNSTPNGAANGTSNGASAFEQLSGLGETIRVSAVKLDTLMAQLSELLVTKIRAEQRLAQIRQAQTAMVTWQKDWQSARAAYSRLTRKGHDIGLWFGSERILRRSVDSLTARGLINEEHAHTAQLSSLSKDLAQLLNYVNLSQERLRDMMARMDTLTREYANDTQHMSLVIDALEQEIKRVRMLPLNTITGAFGRMVRDLAQASGKDAVLEICGGEVELDKRMLEQIKDPLMHLLRNAVDHGIERPEQRQAIGKSRTGHILLSAEHLGKDVVVRVSDDGTGLDLEAIRRVVARRIHAEQQSKETGLSGSGDGAAQEPDATSRVVTRRGYTDPQTLSKEELVELIFNPGITTATMITDVSGRGLGLDIVRRNVEGVRGHIDVDSLPGGGTQFTLTLPLTLTSSRGLLVRVSNELFAIPHSAIGRILTVTANEIVSLEGQETMRFNGRPITLVHLSDVLSLPRLTRAQAASSWTVLVLMAAERRMAFVVDELVGEQDVVIMGLGKQLSRIGGLAGATLLGNGEAVLILNVADLIKLALHGGQRPMLNTVDEEIGVVQARKRILIVDDSITTRTLEKNILEAAGYQVLLATDGQEALNVMATEALPDLIVSDISMPRLDGFGLTRQVKAETRTAELPIILVTSLDSQEDKARGIEAGADAYILKSSFDQNNLLETIEQLI